MPNAPPPICQPARSGTSTSPCASARKASRMAGRIAARSMRAAMSCPVMSRMLPADSHAVLAMVRAGAIGAVKRLLRAFLAVRLGFFRIGRHQNGLIAAHAAAIDRTDLVAHGLQLR